MENESKETYETASIQRMTSQLGDVVMTSSSGEVLDTPEKIRENALEKLKMLRNTLVEDDSRDKPEEKPFVV